MVLQRLIAVSVPTGGAARSRGLLGKPGGRLRMRARPACLAIGEVVLQEPPYGFPRPGQQG
jgi:hypothetical protein